MDARPLAHHQPEVELGRGAAAADADHGDPAPGGERLQVLGQVAGADELEHDVEGAVLAEALGLDHLRAQLLDPVAQLLAPDGRRHARAGGAAELHAGRPHSAGRPVDEQVLAWAQPGLGEDRVVGGGEDLGDAARLRPVERVRDRHRGALVHDGQLGLAAAADDRHHPVADVEALRAGAERGHLAGQLEPGMSGGEPGGAG